MGKGFASLTKERLRELASKGGKAAHRGGHAHEWTADEAAEAGRKGGLSTHARRKQATAFNTVIDTSVAGDAA